MKSLPPLRLDWTRFSKVVDPVRKTIGVVAYPGISRMWAQRSKPSIPGKIYIDEDNVKMANRDLGQGLAWLRGHKWSGASSFPSPV